MININESSSIDDFIEALANIELINTFNPYSHICPTFDTRNAASIRRNNLRLVIKNALRRNVDSLWIARDLGYRGGRRTGLALTDEVHLDSHAKLFDISQLQRSTKGPIVSERTAAIIWQILCNINKTIFLWNIFPLHPHQPKSPMTNRCHTKTEQEICAPLLIWLLQKLKPKKIITIGRDSTNTLNNMGIPSITVRHPSYGGQREFLEKISLIYGLSDIKNHDKDQMLLF